MFLERITLKGVMNAIYTFTFFFFNFWKGTF